MDVGARAGGRNAREMRWQMGEQRGSPKFEVRASLLGWTLGAGLSGSPGTYTNDNCEAEDTVIELSIGLRAHISQNRIIYSLHHPNRDSKECE